MFVHRFAWTEGIAEECELHTREVSLPIDVLAVHDSGFIRMQFESTLPEALANPVQCELGLRQTPAMNHAVIRIAAEPHAWEMTGDPCIECIVQEQVCQ